MEKPNYASLIAKINEADYAISSIKTNGSKLSILTSEGNNLLEFFGNQLVVFNPFTIGALVYVLIVRKFDGLFEPVIALSAKSHVVAVSTY